MLPSASPCPLCLEKLISGELASVLVQRASCLESENIAGSAIILTHYFVRVRSYPCQVGVKSADSVILTKKNIKTGIKFDFVFIHNIY